MSSAVTNTLYELDWEISTLKPLPASTDVKSLKNSSSVTRLPEPTTSPRGAQPPRNIIVEINPIITMITTIVIKAIVMVPIGFFLLFLKGSLTECPLGGIVAIPHLGQNLDSLSNSVPQLEQNVNTVSP